jgi:hypothetical protein
VKYLDSVFHQRLITKIKDQIEVLTADLAAGVSNWEAYLKTIGNIHGLNEALDIIETIKKEMCNDE